MVMGEQISRFMDGELDGADADRAYSALGRTEDKAAWVCYHVIGDALRGSTGHAPGFAERFAQRLAAEPTVLAPRPRAQPRLPLPWALAATVAAVAVVGWVALTVSEPQTSAVATAREGGATQAVPGNGEPLAPDYLIAHQEFSPATQIHGVGPYLRAVSAEGVDARR
jgi:sigma-E factor negative regulatory protein RseA